jgi:predicted HTH domain antitoxin
VFHEHGRWNVNLIISDEVLEAAELSERDLRIELALALYTRGNLSLGKAAEVAEVSVSELMRQMGDREIPLNYDAADLEHDLRTLRKLEAR